MKLGLVDSWSSSVLCNAATALKVFHVAQCDEVNSSEDFSNEWKQNNELSNELSSELPYRKFINNDSSCGYFWSPLKSANKTQSAKRDYRNRIIFHWHSSWPVARRRKVSRFSVAACWYRDKPNDFRRLRMRLASLYAWKFPIGVFDWAQWILF